MSYYDMCRACLPVGRPTALRRIGSCSLWIEIQSCKMNRAYGSTLGKPESYDLPVINTLRMVANGIRLLQVDA